MAVFGSCDSLLFMAGKEFRMDKNLDLAEIIKALFKAIFIVIMVYVSFQVLKAIIGGTWATENIIIAGLGIILGGMFVIVGFLINQGKGLGMIEERTRLMGESLSNLGKDFREHTSKYPR